MVISQDGLSSLHFEVLACRSQGSAYSTRLDARYLSWESHRYHHPQCYPPCILNDWLFCQKSFCEFITCIKSLGTECPRLAIATGGWPQTLDAEKLDGLISSPLVGSVWCQADPSCHVTLWAQWGQAPSGAYVASWDDASPELHLLILLWQYYPWVTLMGICVACGHH